MKRATMGRRAAGILSAVVLALLAPGAVAQAPKGGDLGLARQAAIGAPHLRSPEERAASIAAAAERGIQTAMRVNPRLRLTPYAREQIKAAGLAATRAHEPQMREAVVQAFAREFSSAELRRIIALQNQPLNRKMPQARAILRSGKPAEVRMRELDALLTDEEMAALDRQSADPATLQLLARVNRLIDALSARPDPVRDADLQRRLKAACATAREPLPWCPAGRR